MHITSMSQFSGMFIPDFIKMMELYFPEGLEDEWLRVRQINEVDSSTCKMEIY